MRFSPFFVMDDACISRNLYVGNEMMVELMKIMPDSCQEWNAEPGVAGERVTDCTTVASLYLSGEPMNVCNAFFSLFLFLYNLLRVICDK